MGTAKKAMFSVDEIYTLLDRGKEFFALTDQTNPSSYAYLIIYALLNVGLLLYRSSLTIGAIVYLLILAIMYATAFFWEGMPSIFLWLYGGASFFVILLEGRRILTPFALMNIFACLVVIPQAAGGAGKLGLDMFFEEGLHPLLLNTLWGLNSMAHTFLLLFAPVFVLVELYFYWRRRRALKKKREEWEKRQKLKDSL